MQEVLRKIRFWFVALGSVLLIGIMLSAAFRMGSLENIKPPFQAGHVSFEQWIEIKEGKEQRLEGFPYLSESKEGLIYCRIPDDVGSGDVLVFSNDFQKISVSVEGEEIYSYGAEEDSRYFIPADLKCYIKMLPQYRGKRLEVRITAYLSRTTAALEQPVWSTEGAIVRETLKENMAAGLFFIISGIGGLILLVFSVVWMIKNPAHPGMIFVSLGLFMLLSSVWVITDSDLLQLYISNSQIILFASFEAFFLLPVPFLWFMEQLSIRRTKVFGWLRYAFGLNCMIQNLIFLAGISDFIHMVIITHIIIFVSIIYIIYCMVKESVRYHLLYAKGVLAGITGFALLSGISIISFYRSNGTEHEIFFILGFALLMLDLLLMSIYKLKEFTESGVKEKIYRELAFQDVLTGLGNRNLYEKKLEKLENQTGTSLFSVAVMDINGLKKVNDNLGHAEGDRLIRGGAKCIRSVFGGKGECFRIGGDEFVVLMPDMEADIELCKSLLNREIDSFNKDSKMCLSMSAGFAVKGRQNAEVCLRELIKKADYAMYQEKRSI